MLHRQFKKVKWGTVNKETSHSDLQAIAFSEIGESFSLNNSVAFTWEIVNVQSKMQKTKLISKEETMARILRIAKST